MIHKILRMETTAERLDLDLEFLRKAAVCGAIEEKDPERNLYRLRKIKRVCDALDVEPSVALLILELVERIEEAEEKLGRKV